MRFMVLGATGMAGHMVALYLQERGYEVLGWSRRPAVFLEQHAEGDAYDLDGLFSSMTGFRPDVVVNCIGLLLADSEAHHDQAVYLDAYFPHAVASMSEHIGTRVFHLSTDCVFKGNGGPYSEASVPDATEFYGRAKALGELRDSRNLTLRQSIVGPDIDSAGIGLLNWFMAQRGSVDGWTSAVWTGLTTLELARAVEACATDGTTGLVNMVPDGTGVTKFELLSLFNRFIRRQAIVVRPVEGRGADKSLIRTALPDAYRPAPYEQQMEELSAWIRSHVQLYPHYQGALEEGVA